MPRGVYIRQVYAGTPAETAGLAKGDIITSIDGSAITSYEDLQEEMQFHASGSTVEVTVQRPAIGGYEEMTVMITLVSREDIQ